MTQTSLTPDFLIADVVVIGAGVIGLACARVFAMAGRDVIILEHESHFGTQTSSRNSEVIHAGIYYPTGSAKAELCVSGAGRLYDFCEKRNVNHRMCGKLIVSTDSSTDIDLQALFNRGEANGVPGLSVIEGRQARRLEPSLSDNITAAILSERTGIIDSHGYMLALLGEVEDAGGRVAYRQTIVSGSVERDFVELNIVRAENGSKSAKGANPLRLRASLVINAAGNQAIGIAQAIEGLHRKKLPQARFAKGSYFDVSGPAPFKRLIYPMPNKAGLGIHTTLDLAGRCRLGPDVEWLDAGTAPAFDFAVNEDRLGDFVRAAQSYWPGVKPASLSPAYSGVRPKIVGPGDPPGDFILAGTGRDRLVNLLGIESPGLTASLALADSVLRLCADK